MNQSLLVSFEAPLLELFRKLLINYTLNYTCNAHMFMYPFAQPVANNIALGLNAIDVILARCPCSVQIKVYDGGDWRLSCDVSGEECSAGVLEVRERSSSESMGCGMVQTHTTPSVVPLENIDMMMFLFFSCVKYIPQVI